MIEVEKLAKSLTVLRSDGTVRPVEEAPPLRALSGEVVNNLEEIVLIPETNELRNRQVNATPVRDSNGEIIGSVSVVRDITELKSSLKTIEKAAREWRTTFDGISDAIWLIDPDFKIIRANVASERLLGLTPSELIGKYCWEIVHGAAGPVDGCPAARTIKTLKPETSLMKLGKLWVNISVYPVFGDEGELTGIVHTIHDVTKEKKVEDELLLRNSAMENAANAIMITDTKGTIIWINSAFEKLTQYTAADVIGSTPGAVLKSGKHSAEFYNELWSKIKSGQTWKGEIINKKKDGSIYIEEMTVAPVRNASGEIRNYIAIKLDITDKKFAEDLLNARLELVDFSDNHSLEEILIKTLDEVELFTYSTISFFHFLEDDQATLSLQAWSSETSKKFCKAEGKGMHYNVEDAGVWADCIREKGPVVHNEYMSLPHKKGLPKGHAPVIREMVIPIMRDHKVKAILGVGNKLSDYTERDISVTTYFADIAWDIIERKRAVEYLKQFNRELEVRVAERTALLEKANKELDSFSYSVSHDLRSPLRHITGFIEMFRLETGDLLNEKAKHYMDVIDESARKMSQLIDDLLSFSRMGRASLSSNNVNMNNLVIDVLKDFSDDILDYKISVVRNSLPAIKGDRAMLRVVYVNLISNAIKFSKKKTNPEIVLGHEIINGMDTFFVRDNGVGFNMQYAPKLFGLFQRLHNDRDFSGTGIGLAMVKNIIERHNGRIWAESEPDKGACFYFVLPGSETGRGFLKDD
jgi:PAS domain S-box-containing protein